MVPPLCHILPRTLTKPFTFSCLPPRDTREQGCERSGHSWGPKSLSSLPNIQAPSSRKPFGLEAHQEEMVSAY